MFHNVMIPVATKLNSVMNGKLKGLCCGFKVMKRQTIKRLSGGKRRNYGRRSWKPLFKYHREHGLSLIFRGWNIFTLSNLRRSSSVPEFHSIVAADLVQYLSVTITKGRSP